MAPDLGPSRVGLSCDYIFYRTRSSVIMMTDSAEDEVPLPVHQKDWEYVLIDAYEDSECLWQVNTKDYRNKQKRQIALERIAAKVGKTGE